MALIRMQVTHVDYWRGSPHRWHSTLHYSFGDSSKVPGAIPDAYSKLQAMGPAAYGGGIAEIAMYDAAAGGVPIASTTYFPWQTPASWIPYTGTGWTATGAVAPTTGEAAAHFRTQAGLSKTGKPVFVGLYWHAFYAVNDNAAGVQFSSAVQSTMAGLYNALQVLQSGGIAAGVQVTPRGGSIAGTGALLPYVVSHQRTRGRRRKTTIILPQNSGAIQVQGVKPASEGAAGEVIVP